MQGRKVGASLMHANRNVILGLIVLIGIGLLAFAVEKLLF